MTTNLIESSQAARADGARLLRQDRAALDARCEDARCIACGRPSADAARCEHFEVCKLDVRLLDESEDTQGGAL